MIEFRGISKSFGGVVALREVSVSVRRGECHAFMGENGAGKSTLGKILAGIHRPDAGTVVIDGRAVRFASPRDALRAGIGMVPQELAFYPDLTVAENVCVGRYPRRAGFFLDRAAMDRRARTLLERIGSDIDPAARMRVLSTARQQLVQIASALGAGATILVFDEPTSSLSENESRRLRAVIADLKKKDVTILYISHRMEEVFELADRLSVLRDGALVLTTERGATTPDAIVRCMIGRALTASLAVAPTGAAGAELLRVVSLAPGGSAQPVSFTLRAGEILGVAGLVGSGRSELVRALFGLDARASGSVVVGGATLRPHSVRHAKRAGLALVPEDRRREGLALSLSCMHNFSVTSLHTLRRGGLLDRRRERARARAHFDALAIKAPSLDAPVEHLSGGNQQKVVLAKWLACAPRVLLVDEPTRGIDIGAKQAIHTLLSDLARQGLGIIIVSSELPELLALSHRVLVLREGAVVADVPTGAATQESLLRLMAGL
ncbi:MAG: sugar ABC transporter ATP-binding protein [Ignavibacteria bacterium]|nr:sugar ABC transporter ATP-binding protein [Ignavibacteria bacterium]